MKNIKGIFTIIGLLALGFISGFFTHRQVTIQRVEKVREIGQAPGFQRHLLNFLEPDVDQREKIEPIISRYAQQMGKQLKEHRQDRKALVDAMHEEIKPLLTKEQLQKLDDFSKRFRPRKDMKGKSRREKRPGKSGLEQ